MYDLILNALFHLNGLHSDIAKAEFLQSLQPKVRQLRAAYGNSFVDIDYSDRNIQAAYMIAYFPYYSKIISVILNILKYRRISLPFIEHQLSASFFGAGPCPEICGLLQFLKIGFHNVQNVTAYTFDILAQEWDYSRSITVNHLIPHIWGGSHFNLISNSFDLSQAGSVNNFGDVVSSSDLIVFQNCLNEMRPTLYSNVIDNFRSLIERWMIEACC